MALTEQFYLFATHCCPHSTDFDDIIQKNWDKISKLKQKSFTRKDWGESKAENKYPKENKDILSSYSME